MKRSFLFLLLSLFLCSQTRKSTSADNQLSETALSYCKSGNYSMARDIYLKKIGLGKASPDDYYNLGKVYYNLKDYKMADSILAVCNEKKSDFIPGFMWRARSLSNLDPDSKDGKAKPVYEIILEKTGRHPEKYEKERIEALYYITYYYFRTYNESKQKEIGVKAMVYAEKVIECYPYDENAKKAAKIIEILKKEINN